MIKSFRLNLTGTFSTKDWIDNNKVCPKCAAEVDFVDLEPE